METFLQLPEELFEVILSAPNLTLRDLLRATQVSKRWQSISTKLVDQFYNVNSTFYLKGSTYGTMVALTAKKFATRTDETDAPRAVVKVSQGTVWDSLLSPNGRFLIACAKLTVNIAQLPAEGGLPPPDPALEFALDFNRAGQCDQIESMCFCRDSRTLILATKKVAAVADIVKQQVYFYTPARPNDRRLAIAASIRDDMFVTFVQQDRLLVVYRYTGLKGMSTEKWPPKEPTIVTSATLAGSYVGDTVLARFLHTSDDLVIVSGRDVHIIDALTGQELRTFDLGLEFKAMSRFLVTSDNKHIVVGTDHGSVSLFHLESGQQVRDFKGHSSLVWWLSLSPNGKTLFSSGVTSEMTVRLWRLDTAENFLTIENNNKWTGIWPVVASSN